MEIYNLEKQDYVEIENIFSTTASISELYTRLYKLETEGNFGSEEYMKTLEYLKISLEVENKLYKQANLDSEKCRKWYKYIQFKELYTDHNFGIEAILEQDYKNSCAKRIIATLTTIAGEKDCVWNVSDGYFEGQQQVDIIKEIRNDIFSIFTTIIKPEKNENLKEQTKIDFIIAKYYTLFMFKTYEEQLLENDFKIPKIPTINSRFFADLTKIDPSIYKEMNQKYPFRLYNDQYEKTIYLNYNSLDEVSSAFLLRIKFMTAILIQVDTEIFNIIYFTILNELAKSNVIDNDVIANLIAKSIEEANDNKHKKRIIRLGNNKVYKK